MKERFIKRYEKACRDYFNYSLDDEGARERLYILEEYKKILHEEFGVTKEQTSEIYHKLYWEKYGKR